MSVNHSAGLGGIIFNIKVCCVFLLESPHGGDSNEYTQYTIFNIKKYLKFAAMGLFPRDSKNEIETAVVNEPSVFELQKFFCIYQGSVC